MEHGIDTAVGHFYSTKDSTKELQGADGKYGSDQDLQP